MSFDSGAEPPMLVGSRVRKSTIPKFWPPLINKPGSDFLLLFHDHLRSPIPVLTRPPHPPPSLNYGFLSIRCATSRHGTERSGGRKTGTFSPFPLSALPRLTSIVCSISREITMSVRLPAIIVTYQWTQEPKPAGVPFLGKTLQGTKWVIPSTLFRGTVSVNGGSAW